MNLNINLKSFGIVMAMIGLAITTASANSSQNDGVIGIDETNSSIPSNAGYNYYGAGNGSTITSIGITYQSGNLTAGNYYGEKNYGFLQGNDNYTILNGASINGFKNNLIYGTLASGYGFYTSDGTNINTLPKQGTNFPQVFAVTSYGFIDDQAFPNVYNDDGTTTTLFPPDAITNSVSITGADQNFVFSTYLDSNSNTINYIFDGTNYTTVDYSNNTPFTPVGVINNLIIGNSTSLPLGGVIFDGTNDQIIDITAPWQNTTTFLGVSGTDIVGTYGDTNTDSWSGHGFLFDQTNYTLIDDTDPMALPVDGLNKNPDTNAIPVYGSTTITGWDSNTITGTFLSKIIDNVHNIQDQISFSYNKQTKEFTTLKQPRSGTTIIGLIGNTPYSSNNYSYYGNYTDLYGAGSIQKAYAKNWYYNITSFTQPEYNGNAFYFDGTNYNEINPPDGNNAYTTIIGKISNTIVGSYIDTNNNSHGFLFDGTNYIVVDSTNADVVNGTTTFNFVSGSNIAGTYKDTNGGTKIFIYNNDTGIAIPEPVPVTPTSYVTIYLNNSTTNILVTNDLIITGLSGQTVIGQYTEQVSGYWDDGKSTFSFVPNFTRFSGSKNIFSFIATPTNYTKINMPFQDYIVNMGSKIYGIYATAIDSNTITGYYVDSNLIWRGFKFDRKNYTRFNINSSQTFPIGVSGKYIVGYSLIKGKKSGLFNYDKTVYEPFIFDGKKYTKIKIPNTVTKNIVINGCSNNIVYGNYTDTNELVHGFITPAIPIEQNSVILSTNGLQSQSVSLPLTNNIGSAISYTIISGPATLSNNTIYYNGAGDVVIKQTVAGNSYYSGMDTTTKIAVPKLNQVVTLPDFSTYTYGDASFLLNGQNTSSNAIVYTSSNPKIAEIIGGNLIIKGAGEATITALAKTDKNFLASNIVKKDIIINKASQTIIFNSPANNSIVSKGTIINLSTLNPKQTPINIGFRSSNNKNLTIKKGIAYFKKAGTYTITATEAGNINYLPATSVSNTITVQ